MASTSGVIVMLDPSSVDKFSATLGSGCRGSGGVRLIFASEVGKLVSEISRVGACRDSDVCAGGGSERGPLSWERSEARNPPR